MTDILTDGPMDILFFSFIRNHTLRFVEKWSWERAWQIMLMDRVRESTIARLLLFVYTYVYQSICLSIFLSTYVPIYLFTYLPTHLSTYLSTYIALLALLTVFVSRSSCHSLSSCPSLSLLHHFSNTHYLTIVVQIISDSKLL